MLFCLPVLNVFHLDHYEMEIACLALHFLVRNNSLVHEVKINAAVEIHLNATYAQHPALKSVCEKSQ